MTLDDAMNSINMKMAEQGSYMSNEEANILKANLDNEEAMCFYAMGLFMNSSVRFKKLFFRGYDALQEEAFALLYQCIEKNIPLAIYLMGQIKCGLFGKFPRYPEEGRKLFEKYCDITSDETVKNNILDDWDNYNAYMKEHFDDMRIYEVMNDLRNQGFTDFSSHDDAYYEECSKNNKETNYEKSS